MQCIRYWCMVWYGMVPPSTIPCITDVLQRISYMDLCIVLLISRRPLLRCPCMRPPRGMSAHTATMYDVGCFGSEHIVWYDMVWYAKLCLHTLPQCIRWVGLLGFTILCCTHCYIAWNRLVWCIECAFTSFSHSGGAAVDNVLLDTMPDCIKCVLYKVRLNSQCGSSRQRLRLRTAYLCLTAFLLPLFFLRLLPG